MRPYPYNRRVVDRRGKYRWLQLAVVAPAVISVVIHAGAALWVRGFSLVGRENPLTDAPVETILTLDVPRRAEPPPVRVPEPEPEPEPPPPAPVPERKPPPPRVETRPAPAPSPNPEPTQPKAAPATTGASPAAEEPARPAPPPSPEPAPPPRPASFAGVKADVAARVVYVVDASGAMTTSLSFVIDELARSIERLDESQLFQVILFREPPPDGGFEASAQGYEMFRSGLVPATRANKDAAQAWAYSIRPLGKSSPLPGLAAALSLNPDLVFLLSRSIQRTGTEPRVANISLLNTLEELNPPSPISRARPTVIKTIQFIEDDPSGLLQAIAARHGDGVGSYRLLSLDELAGK